MVITQKKSSNLEHLVIPINGMSCASCASRIEKNIAGLEGVMHAGVNFGAEQASVDYDADKVSPAEVREVIEKLGFKVSATRESFTVEGMTCASCVSRVENKLRGLHGVLDVQVNLAAGRVLIDYFSSNSGARDFRYALNDIGYTLHVDEESKVEEVESEDQRYVRKITTLTRRFAFSIFTVVVIMFSGMESVQSFSPKVGSTEHNLLLLMLATPVQFWAGWGFYRGTWTGIMHGYSDMNTLITIGTSFAYFYSAFVTVFPGFFLGIKQEVSVYFDSSVMIIALVLMGQLLESRAKAKASSAIRNLIGLQPKNARVERDNIEEGISIAQVVEGDTVIVRPGERIPVDGIIINGSTSVDESMISGESIPVDKNTNESVVGSSLNKTGFFKMRATRLGKDSVLSQIIRLVEEAQGSKAPVQRLADKISGIFVPIVIGVATLSFFGWWLFGASMELPTSPFVFALMAFIAVMIIACPCALGLATPAAIMAGVGKGAESGILIKGGEVLERVGKLHTILFDKTGTLTEGIPELNDVVLDSNSEFSMERLLIFAASLEKKSEHPLAKAVVNEARKRNLNLEEMEEFKALPGFGVRASLNHHEIVLGNMNLMNKNGISVEHWVERLEEFARQGKTSMILAVSKKVVGVITVVDKVRPYARETVERLKKLGLEVGMITGDSWNTARAVASQLGIKTVLAEVLPGDKANEVKKLQAKGQLVSMVGDGINDAPALSRADLGIALGSGIDVAVEASDITLMTSDLRAVADAIELSKKTMIKIKQNLFFAFFYNCLGIPIAAGVLYPAFGIMLKPVYAALAMAFSSVSVVTNSLLLKKVNLRK